MWPILQLFRPFASMMFYRSYVKKDVARDIRRRYPQLNQEEAEILAEMKIQNNNVPALDPLGNFRGVYNHAKKDPRTIGQQIRDILGWVLIVWFVLAVLLRIFVSLAVH